MNACFFVYFLIQYIHAAHVTWDMCHSNRIFTSRDNRLITSSQQVPVMLDVEPDQPRGVCGIPIIQRVLG